MSESDKQIRTHERHNFWVLALNQILVRIGWIFKTETVVMPGFLDTLTPSAMVRGFLPLISRFGQSIPQYLISHRLTHMPRKHPLFLASSFGFALPWLLLALILSISRLPGGTMAGVFLFLYALHWLAFGCNTLANGTLQGKLIRAERRGRLLAYSNVMGCTLAIGAVILLLPRWLTAEEARYTWVFGTTGLFFGVAATTLFLLREPPDVANGDREPLLKFLGGALLLLRVDRDFRRLIWVLLLSTVILLLFPHYTVFGKRTLGLVSRNFMLLLVVQNAVNALGSFALGNVADRRGNRIVLRILMFIAACVPLMALGISRLTMGARIYWIVYAFLGFTPVAGRITVNYALEIAPPEKHPQYLGVLSLCQALPMVGSPFLGLLIDYLSFEPVFMGGSAVLFCAALLTFRLAEPRYDLPSSQKG